jgi:hypothetical protein
MVQKKRFLSYVEFMRIKYELDNKQYLLKKIFVIWHLTNVL